MAAVRLASRKRVTGIDFGEDDEVLEDMTWDAFFRVFDERKLSLVYQEHTADGKLSRFGKFVRREPGE